MSAVSSTNAPPNGAAVGRTACAPAHIASMTGIGGTPRRALPAAASWPCRITASCHPPLAVRAGGHHFRDGRQCAAAAGRATARRSRWRRDPAAGRRFRSGRARRGRRCAPARRPARGCRGRRSVRRRAPCGDGVVDGGDVARRGTRRQFALGAAGPCSAERPSRAVQVRTPVNRASSAAVSRRRRRATGTGRLAQSCFGCPHRRKPRKRFVGQHHPPPPVRKLRPPVVGRRVRGEQPQLAHARLEVVRALDVVHRGGQRRHLLDAGARVGAVEVLADPSAQIDGGPDVEHLGGRARGTGTRRGDAAVRRRGDDCGAAPVSRRADTSAARCRCARPGCRPARSARAARRRWRARRRVHGASAWSPRRTVGPARPAARWAPRRG